MKYFQIIVIFLLFYKYSYSTSDSFPLPPWGGNIHVPTAIDSGNIRVLYAMNAVNISDINTYDDLQRLEIGTTLSKYYSYDLYRGDSLVKEDRKKNPNAQSRQGVLRKIGKKINTWSVVIYSEYFKNFKENTLSEFQIMPLGCAPRLYYIEDIPKQEWKLHDDTLTICGYLCQKATCRFRGSDFVAWFALEIPLSNGPWKFGGLPGLILKVNDNDNYYIFECIKIEFHTSNFPITICDVNFYQKTERLKLRNYEKNIYNDYFKICNLINMDGTPLPFDPVPYHPLELE